MKKDYKEPETAFIKFNAEDIITTSDEDEGPPIFDDSDETTHPTVPTDPTTPTNPTIPTDPIDPPDPPIPTNPTTPTSDEDEGPIL